MKDFAPRYRRLMYSEMPYFLVVIWCSLFRC